MLELQNVQVNYGDATALWEVSLAINAGELVSVIGPNGAGKTTLINAIMGLNPIRAGRMTWQGDDLPRLPAHTFCERGIALVPEGRRLFTSMTVLENLELGALHPEAKRERAASLERVLDLFPALPAKLKQAAGTLSGGQQQMVALGRALMAKPKLLLLDEPSLGLAPSIVSDMFKTIAAIHAQGTAVLLVEQNVSYALRLSQRTYVLENGRVVTQGPSAELLNRPEIRQAYLGH